MSGDKAPARRRRTPVLPPVGGDSTPSISSEDVAREALGALKARGAAYIKAYVRVEEQPTILLKNLARVLIELRRRCINAGGNSDMRGQSKEYRDLVKEIYLAAGVGKEKAETTQQAVRWHIGNFLRDEMTAEELSDYGLKESSPIERSQDGREQRAAIVAASRATDLAVVSSSAPVSVKATADQITIGKAVHRQLEGIRVDVINDAMTDGQREALDAQLAAAQQLIAKLRRHTRKRASADS